MIDGMAPLPTVRRSVQISIPTKRYGYTVIRRDNGAYPCTSQRMKTSYRRVFKAPKVIWNLIIRDDHAENDGNGTTTPEFTPCQRFNDLGGAMAHTPIEILA